MPPPRFARRVVSARKSPARQRAAREARPTTDLNASWTWPTSFSSWRAYYTWRHTLDTRQNVLPCVRSVNRAAFYCLPGLVVIGAMKGGTTGLREKLIASRQFYTAGSESYPREAHFWDNFLGNASHLLSSSVEAIADAYARCLGSIPAQEFATALTAGRIPRIAIDVTPGYSYGLGRDLLKKMKEVVPDAHLLLLARPGADVHFSSVVMSLENGFFERATPYQVAYKRGGCAQVRNYTASVAAATMRIGREHFFELATSKAAERADPDGYDWHILDEWRQIAELGGSAYALKLFFMVWPRSQITIVDSEALFTREREVYDHISVAARLPSIQLTNGTRTRPAKPFANAAVGHVSSLLKLVETCDLKAPFRCAWYGANERLADVLGQPWPLKWNKQVNAATCDTLSWSANTMTHDTGRRKEAHRPVRYGNRAS